MSEHVEMSSQKAVSASRLVGAVLLTVVALAITVNLIPRDSILGSRANWIFADLQQLTGLDQNWNMFIAVANRHSGEVDIRALDSYGRTHSFGPVLPGLEPYDPQGDSFRYHSVFSRFFTPRFAGYVEPYAFKVARELNRSNKQLELVSFELEFRTEDTSYLHKIREGEPMTYRQTLSRGPWMLDE